MSPRQVVAGAPLLEAARLVVLAALVNDEPLDAELAALVAAAPAERDPRALGRMLRLAVRVPHYVEFAQYANGRVLAASQHAALHRVCLEVAATTQKCRYATAITLLAKRLEPRRPAKYPAAAYGNARDGGKACLEELAACVGGGHATAMLLDRRIAAASRRRQVYYSAARRAAVGAIAREVALLPPEGRLAAAEAMIAERLRC